MRSWPPLFAAHGVGHSAPAAHATSASAHPSAHLELSGRTVLLATDGSPSALAGARLAQAIAATHRATIHVVSVIDTRSAALPPPFDLVLAAGDAALGPAIHAAQEDDVRARIAMDIGQEVDWPVRIMLGTPATAIVQTARETGAALIIVGLRSHGRLDRAMHDETALNVMRHASCPVLGATEGARVLPTRVLAAMDFGDVSVTAVRIARSLVGEHASFVLAHVTPSSALTPDDGETAIQELGVRAEFARVRDDLRDDGITFDHTVLRQTARHSVADALLEYADVIGADLITAGSVHRRPVDRWLVGSVSTDLVRDGRRSVLIVPAAA